MTEMAKKRRISAIFSERSNRITTRPSHAAGASPLVPRGVLPQLKVEVRNTTEDVLYFPINLLSSPRSRNEAGNALNSWRMLAISSAGPSGYWRDRSTACSR